MNDVAVERSMRKRVMLLAQIALALCVAASCAPSAFAAARESGAGFTPNRCEAFLPAGPFPAAGADYQRKYNTIAHRFLDDEIGAGDVTPDMYAILDTLIDDSVAVLKPYQPGDSTGAARMFAAEALHQIDCVLLRRGFVYPGRGLVQLLSDGLGATLYGTEADRAELRNQPHNLRRSAFIAARGAGPFYVVDCDVASYLYLAIAEVMNYPLHLVEIPNHNFVRWLFPDASYLNFETMDGYVTDDVYYRTHWSIPDAFVGIGGIFATMTAQRAQAYHEVSVAIAWSWRGDIEHMRAFYLRSIATDDAYSFALNNLAWFYAAAPKRDQRDGARAVDFARRAVALLPSSDFLDTLACAYAQNGDFAMAVATEEAAIKTGYAPFGSTLAADLAGFKAAPPQSCDDPNFGVDQKPFRPRGATAVRLR